MFWAHHHFSLYSICFSEALLLPHRTFFLFLILFFCFFHLLVRFWSLSYLFACSLTRSFACKFVLWAKRSFICLTFIDDSRDIAVVRCWNICVYTVHYIWQKWAKRLYALLNWQQQLWVSCERVRVRVCACIETRPIRQRY